MTVEDGRVPTCNCPVCNTGTMSIFRDIETKGYRYYCGSCQKSYTAINLFMAARSIVNYKLGLEEIFKELGFNFDNFTKERHLREYVEYSDKQTALQVILSKANWHLVNNMPTLSVDLLELNQLWDGYTPDKITAVFSNTLCCLNWLQFNELLKLIDCSGITRQTFRGRDCFLLPFEVTPGQISSVMLWDTTNRQILRPLKTFDVSEGGILGLQDVANNKECVLFNDPMTYLHLRRLWFTDNVTKPTFACCASRTKEGFDYNTNLAIGLLTHDKVIFWDYGRQVEIINHARILKERGYIATKPSMPADGVANIAAIDNIHKVLSDIAKFAEPWHKVLKTWLVEVLPVEQLALCEKLSPKITADEIELLKAECSTYEWNNIKHCFETRNNIESFRYNDDLIIIRPSLGLYKFTNSPSAEELISEVYPEVREVTVIDNKTYMSGIIHFQSNEIPFIETEENIRRGIGNWLTSKCVETYGFPRINQAYRRNLLDIVLAWKKPEVKKSISHIGWSTNTNSWIFPLFEIANGRFVNTVSNPSTIYLPGVSLDSNNIEFPGQLQIDKWNTGSTSAVTVFALLLGILHNLVAPSINKNKRGIVLVGNTDQCNRVINFIGNQLNLVSMNCKTSMTREDVIDIAMTEKKHDFPVILQTRNLDGKAWAYWMSFLGPRNCITTANYNELIKLTASDQWLIIKVNDVDDENLENTFGEVVKLIPLVLRFIQTSKVKPSNDWSLIGSIASLMESYIKNGYPKFENKVLIKAKNQIAHSPIENWGKFLWSLFYGIEQGLFTVEAWMYSLDDLQIRNNGNLNPVYKGPDNRYYIVYKRCKDIFKHLNLDIPDHDLLELTKPQDVFLNNVGWSVSQDFWDAHYLTWSSIFDHQSFSV